ncbi:ROK family transcriptional regulator [Phycicoccus sp. BSK3Z-2]|uniref:ROK family transcriptional regulator n=1 Tax=Phycicoccus avicenniae TaxID=2828860 RepID=A0A941I274_9MICO|nr:ROK family transcriptional regulator [Phycicoccus avicenniae]MBR7744739.1 ROK family transcriptional regulator [Phycicoccus avicenniae]
MNRLRVLDAVREHGAMTQVEIATATGLSAATVSNLVKELDGAGAVLLRPSIRNGRRATQVSVATARGLLATAVFGDRDVRVAVAAASDEVVAQKRMPLPADHHADEGTDRAARLVHELVEGAGQEMSGLRALVVGLPAPIDTVSGHVGSDGILPGWRGTDVAAAMSDAVRVPVALDNTANLAALGEFKHGALQGVSTGMFVKVSYGAGAGLIIGGELFRGSAGTAGEIGHVTIDENGPVCRCGNRGCLDTFVGASPVLAALRPTHGGLTLRDVITRALDGDPGCRRVLQDSGRHLGVALAGVVTMLNPEVIAIGGQVARLGDLLLGPVRESVERCAIPSAAASVEIRVGELPPDEADVRGGLVLAEQLRDEADRAALSTG